MKVTFWDDVIFCPRWANFVQKHCSVSLSCSLINIKDPPSFALTSQGSHVQPPVVETLRLSPADGYSRKRIRPGSRSPPPFPVRLCLHGEAQRPALANLPVRDPASPQRPSVQFDRIYINIGVGQIFRSEEHTSELQSLMRISYAV